MVSALKSDMGVQGTAGGSGAKYTSGLSLNLLLWRFW